MSRFLVFLFGALRLVGEDYRALDPARHPEPQSILSSYLQRLAAAQLEARVRDVASISSKEAYEKRKARLREIALRMIGGLSEPRNPLNLKVTGTLQRDGYRVDKIVYESRPRFYVTANLYVPRGTAPFPAVLQPVGHSATAKNRAFYQKIALSLVKQGFVVLTYDPIGQGERRLYWDNDLGDSKVGLSTTIEHNMLGWQSLLGGHSTAMFRVWDGIRSIDLLASLPEVDRNRIGVTGCSGGGTLTTYIAALDDRVKAAAPACYISSWDEQLKGTGPQDAEQQFPDQLLQGFDHADWIGLAAPKPYLIVSTDQDFFPVEGARKTFAEMKRVYTLYDAAIKVEWFHEPGGHGVPQASREAIASWMKRWLQGDATPVKDGDLPTEHEEDLNATPTGQVATSLGGETAVSWNIAHLSRLVPARPVSNIKNEVIGLTRYRKSTAPLALQRGRTFHDNGVRVELLAYDSDAGLTIPAALFLPPSGPPKSTVLYLDPRGKAAAVSNPDVRGIVQGGHAVFAPDLSGFGEVAFARTPSAPWSASQVAWLALMVGHPLMGIRMNDISRGLDALQQIGLLPGSGVSAFARGRLAPVLLHAAVVDPRIGAVIAEDSLVSFAAVAAVPLHRDIEDIVVPNILGHYDLPDLAAALAPRPVRLGNLRSPVGRLLFRKDAAAAYNSAGSHVRTILRREEEPFAAAYPAFP